MFGIEAILDVYEKHYGGCDREEYGSFLEEQLDLHREYDLRLNKNETRRRGLTSYPWVNLLVDRVLIFSYLVGDRSITVEDGEEKTINEVEDLTLLTPSSVGVGAKENKRNDSFLLALYFRINNRRYSPPFNENYQYWGTTIDELLGDDSVVEHLGKRVYYRDFSRHGGKRNVKK